jgi:hypothetical protein
MTSLARISWVASSSATAPYPTAASAAKGKGGGLVEECRSPTWLRR